MDRVLRLVIVEGPFVRLQEPLESKGFAVSATAPRGRDLVSLVGRHRPDAVVLDLELFELSGTTAIRRLVERFPEIPVVVLGDSALPTVIITVFEAGARAYIVKTAELDPLARAVRLAVEMGRPRTAVDSSNATRSDDPVWVPGVQRRRLHDRRAATGRRTSAPATPIIERRTGVDRRLRARRHDDPRFEPGRGIDNPRASS
jgi:DNA-binding NarL/FixJ family response regulator